MCCFILKRKKSQNCLVAEIQNTNIFYGIKIDFAKSIILAVFDGMLGMVIMALISAYEHGFIAIGDEPSLAIATSLFRTHPILAIAIHLGANVREASAHNFP